MSPCSARRRLVLQAGLAAPLAGLGGLAAAADEAYPAKPIRLVVPYPPGGGTDTLGRLLGAKLAEAWKATVIVDNKPGASGILGNDAVAKAAPDGHTVLLGITALVQGAALFAKLPYDPVADFKPLTCVARSADLLLVPASSPLGTIEQLVAAAKAEPRKLTVGNYGNGTSSHIHAAMLGGQAGVELTHVPYKGAGPLMNDLLGGQLGAAFVDATSAQPHLGGGKLKVLAVTGARPSPLAPQAPTMTALGYRDFEPYGWFGLFVPAATPQPIARKLADAFVQAIAQPDFQARLQGMGLQAGGNPMDEFAREVKADKAAWARVIQTAQIRLD